MKIISGIASRVAAYNKVANTDGEKKKEKADEAVRVGDKIDLTQKARDFSEISNKVAKSDEVREEKVFSIKKSISDGTYGVPSEKVARKIVEESINIKI